MIKKVLVSSVVILVRRDLKMTAKKASVKISTGFPPEGCGNTPKKLEIVSNRIQNIGYRLIQKERLSSVKYKQSAVFTRRRSAVRACHRPPSINPVSRRGFVF